MKEKLKSLKPSREVQQTVARSIQTAAVNNSTATATATPKPTIAPTIPIRRKKQVVKSTVSAPKVKVKMERIQPEMTASGPFALGPAERGSRLTSVTTTTRQATATEIIHDDLNDSSNNTTEEENDDNEDDYGPRRIKPPKLKKLVDFGLLKPKVENVPAAIPNTNTNAKRAMVIDSDSDQDMQDTAQTVQTVFNYSLL